MACKFGYGKPENKKCPSVAGRKCHCDGGIPLIGITCTKTGAPGCAMCHVGYHAEDSGGKPVKLCKPNECVCEKDGTAAKGVECPVHKAKYCSKCNPGFLPSSGRGACEEIVCQCRIGTPARGTACPSPFVRKCASCPKAGFKLVFGAFCKANRCLCRVNGERAGEALIGAGCPKDGEIACKSCFAAQGYKQKSGSNPMQCQPICKCPGGFGEDLTGKPGCVRPGPGCAKCKAGYWLNDNHLCLPNICECRTLKPAVGPDCPKPGHVKCGKCLGTGSGWLIRIGRRCQTSVACRICGVHVTVNCLDDINS